MFFIYIIYSEKLDRYYIGTTDGVSRRLIEHNNGIYSKSYTTKGIPWRLSLEFECNSSTEANQLEKFIKQMKSRKFIEKIIENTAVLLDIQSKL